MGFELFNDPSDKVARFLPADYYFLVALHDRLKCLTNIGKSLKRMEVKYSKAFYAIISNLVGVFVFIKQLHFIVLLTYFTYCSDNFKEFSLDNIEIL